MISSSRPSSMAASTSRSLMIARTRRTMSSATSAIRSMVGRISSGTATLGTRRRAILATWTDRSPIRSSSLTIRSADDDHAQVAGHRLLEGQQGEGVVLDPLAVGVDGLVGADHLLGDGGVAGQQRRGGSVDGHLDLAAHLGEVGEDGVELVMEGLTHDAQPRWPDVPPEPRAVNAW